MDKNQATGLIIISLMLILYFQFFGGQPQPPQPGEDLTTEKTLDEVRQDSIQPATPADTFRNADIPVVDSALTAEQQARYGDLSAAVSGTEETTVLENKDISITFSSRGGKIKDVLLKDYLTYDKNPLILLDEFSSRTALIANYRGQQIDLHQLFYSSSQHIQNDTTYLTYNIANTSGGYIRQVYSLPPEGFKVGYKIETKGFEYLFNVDLEFNWINDLKSFEKDPVTSRIKTTVGYYLADGTHDDLGERSGDLDSETVNNLKWITFKQHFFTTGFIAGNRFNSAQLSQEVKEQYPSVDKFTRAKIYLPAADLRSGEAKYAFFFGPNSYPLLKKVTPGFEKNIYLGWPPVNLVNKWVIIPIFNWLQKYIDSYGLIILILVLIIKLALSPLSYKSYMSMAKMKVMKPELDALKEKIGDDQQKMQQEQMKLYQQVGVNPLSGCIPMVLQMPILFAMFYFFPSSIELRQESFLWADDLSTYDSIMTLPFSIPMYGDHVSLFVLLMTASTILYTWSNNQMTTVQGPMKSMSYMMPVIFMFVLNSFPAALSFYYFVANIITFGQQAIIKMFVDEEKIKATLDDNRLKNKGKKKSKFQQKLDEAMKASQEAKKVKKK
jgi:YidC/Oxa1 family membrane protein insertase